MNDKLYTIIGLIIIAVTMMVTNKESSPDIIRDIILILGSLATGQMIGKR